MTATDPMEDEAARLNLARVSGAPDAWRARANAAGGFLAAAAAASFLGLAHESSRLNGPSETFAGFGAGAFPIAVVSLLAAGAWPTPAIPEVPQSKRRWPRRSDVNDVPAQPSKTPLQDQLEAWSNAEALPIFCLVWLGVAAAAVAVIATTVAGLILILSTPRTSGMVEFLTPEMQHAARSLCPSLKEPFFGTVTPRAAGTVMVQVAGNDCGGNHPTFIAAEAAVLVLSRP